MKAKPVLVIHGGAGSKSLSRENYTLVCSSLERIVTDVYARLTKGASAVECAVAAVQALEDDPLYNAGKGSKLQSDGKIRMSASLMDGHNRRFAGCVNVERIKNPVHLAAALMKQDDRVLSGPGAERFARTIGLSFASPYTAERKKLFTQNRRGKSGTVGAVVLDRQGRLAAATSTGGKGGEYPCRVSDSPTCAGNFANSICAVSATGTGEEIVEFSVAATICTFMDAGMSLKTSVNRVLTQARRKHAEFGLIAIDRTGNIATQTLTPSLIWAAALPSGNRLMSRHL